MNEKSLFKWGGISAIIFAALLIIFISGLVKIWIDTEIPSKEPTMKEFADWLSRNDVRQGMYSELVWLCLYIVVAFAIYDYLKDTSYSLSRVGYGFALLWIFINLTRKIVSVAGIIIARSGESVGESPFLVIYALDESLWTVVIWLLAAFTFFWGLAFLMLKGKNKLVGGLFLAVTFVRVVMGVFYGIGNITSGSITFVMGHVVFSISLILVGIMLIGASKKEVSSQ